MSLSSPCVGPVSFTTVAFITSPSGSDPFNLINTRGIASSRGTTFVCYRYLFDICLIVDSRGLIYTVAIANPPVGSTLCI